MTRAGNRIYETVEDLPLVVPVFPLPGVLLLPRRTLPLEIFEPRYLAMTDAVLAGERLIGMIQPRLDVLSVALAGRPPLEAVGCLGRLTRYVENGDGRLSITLTGVSRFRIAEELATTTPYRQVRIDVEPFTADFRPGTGEAGVDRGAVLATLRAFVTAHRLDVEWSRFETASNEALVDGLAMMSPCGPREKQALLEKPSLAARAELLIALTERALGEAEGGGGGGPLQ
ncbi:peptidase S16 [Siculibacillus lacustris]|uniref:Peptidase S16 n=1 Tax=Siculibacillus lacustris TaxID=1549641 RepID=A0A4Q9VL12_9HYPH|nr:LON peptidase substrate-binding domain-containing protein [Siculibacillus lacustris]TBW36140.1 peptidase S16 [Siculibacillus lacustris]